uniref:Uncharacterized protein n=1 Tax=Molossus molossus TaxID=27622 RepID=A0A7J8E302_MOLMO|nr:hypothetical protein HJG59_009042 [Molossus molossus]
MPKSRSRPEYPTAHVDNSTGLICRLGKMQPPALPHLLLILCPVTWCETWSCHCNIVVENGTLEPACQGLNSDLATYCVTLASCTTCGAVGGAGMTETATELTEGAEFPLLVIPHPQRACCQSLYVIYLYLLVWVVILF